MSILAVSGFLQSKTYLVSSRVGDRIGHCGMALVERVFAGFVVTVAKGDINNMEGSLAWI